MHIIVREPLVLFKASLSNGENVYEGKGKYHRYPNKPAPWRRLLTYCKKNRLSITSVSLYTRDGRTFNLPSAGNNPKFHAFTETDKPYSYRFFRKMGQNLDSNRADLFTVVEANYDTYVLQLWVDEHARNVWSLVL